MKLLIAFCFFIPCLAYGACTSTAYGAATCIQAAGSNKGTSGTTHTQNITTTAGRTIIVTAIACANNTCSSDTSGITLSISASNGSESFTTIDVNGGTAGTQYNPGGGNREAYAAWVVPSTLGVTSYTVTCSSTCWYPGVSASEWTGLDTSSPVDGTGNGCNTTGGSPLACSVTTTNAATVLYEHSDGCCTGTSTPTSGFSQILFQNGIQWAKNVSSSGSQTGDITFTGGSDMNIIIFAIKIASASTPVPRRRPLSY